MKIRAKLTLLLLALGVCTVLTSSYIAYYNAREALIQSVYNQLTGVRRSKAFQIESYFRTVRRHVQTLSESQLFLSGMNQFRAAFLKLDGGDVPFDLRAALAAYYARSFLPELHRFVDPRFQIDDYMPAGRAAYYLQYHYIVKNPNPPEKKQDVFDAGDGSEYSRVHAAFHNSYKRLVERFGYDDLYLIDHESGRIVYNYSKSPDIGTSLLTGPYRDTNLARIFRKCRQATNSNEFCFADFEASEASYGAPTAYVCSPIFSKGKVIGVLVLQLGIGELDRVVSGDRSWERDGLGKSGDSGVVGPDHLLRSNSRGFIDNPELHLSRMRARGVPEKTILRIRAYNTTVLQQEVRLPSVDEALAGREGTRVQLGSSGGRTLISYGPLDVEGIHWTLASRIDESEALAPVEAMKWKLIRFTILVLAATLLVAAFLSRALVRRLSILDRASRRLAAGDLSARVPVTSKDELGHLACDFNAMAESIQQKSDLLAEKNRENEALLLNILPGPIAQRLKDGESVIADSFAEVTVLFADLVGFTAMSGGRPPNEVVAFLNDLFRRFDAIATRLGIEKIKTIGDAYMAVAGLPTQYPDHADRMAQFALEMTEQARLYSVERGQTFELRIGLNTGPVVAGVIGATKFIYDLWGDTVNIASRMESHGLPGTIHVTRAVYDRLKDSYEFESRGEIDVKGKGIMETWLLLRPVPAAAPRA